MGKRCFEIVKLPEGTKVWIEVVGTTLTLTPEEAEEFAAWERASDEAWALIGQEEAEQSHETR